mmetsp:Transcript_33231/g.94155  ORF Transcript_33231/g.94155 Transcript_33231/m.94155 type:complete len:244 (-) Transcript_33231:45-776(-)
MEALSHSGTALLPPLPGRKAAAGRPSTTTAPPVLIGNTRTGSRLSHTGRGSLAPSHRPVSAFRGSGGNRRRSLQHCSPAENGRAAAAAEAAESGGQSTGSPAPVFHLAFPVRDVDESRDFYGRVLGLAEGRSSDRWVDFSLYGHQLVCHQVDGYSASGSQNAVDGDPVPVPHFGLAMTKEQLHELAGRLEAAGVTFVIKPHLRFQGQPGEQWTMFFKDPSGNALEFKAMTNPENLFAKYHVDC